jgi:hypothetical protein
VEFSQQAVWRLWLEQDKKGSVYLGTWKNRSYAVGSSMWAPHRLGFWVFGLLLSGTVPCLFPGRCVDDVTARKGHGGAKSQPPQVEHILQRRDSEALGGELVNFSIGRSYHICYIRGTQTERIVRDYSWICIALFILTVATIFQIYKNRHWVRLEVLLSWILT